MTGGRIALVVIVLLWPISASASAATYEIGVNSQQAGPEKASVGASVGVRSSSPSSPGEQNVSSEELGETASGESAGAEEVEPARANGESCQSLPVSAVPCYGVVAAGPEETPKGEAAPPVNPAVLAAGAASRLSFGAGRVEASPSAHVDGLTGANSWFWLSPAPPSTQTVSAAARGEHVTVTASASTVRWTFGDGSSLAGGAGVPYTSGSVPSDAILHDYRTRCLPGDQGHDPYVLASCGPDGYTVTATVEWGVSFSAHGRVTSSGSLPTRSTASSLTYPVSEARAFLSAAGGEK